MFISTVLTLLQAVTMVKVAGGLRRPCCPLLISSDVGQLARMLNVDIKPVR